MTSPRAPGSPPPRLSVVIATRNRRDAVLDAVGSTLAQRGVEIDVQVYDDCSDDDTASAVRERFPEVRVERSEVHVERLVLRNRGIREAQSPFVLVLDDDCYFTADETLRLALEVFTEDDVGVACLPIVEPYRPRPEGYPWCRARRGESLGSFLGGASIFRRAAVLGVGGYREFLVHHHEERDLGLRLLDAGWRFVYCGGPTVVHTLDPRRDKKRQVRSYARNEVLVGFLNYPGRIVAPRLLASSLRLLLLGYLQYPFTHKLVGLLDGVSQACRRQADRRAISMDAYRAHREQPSHGPERYRGSLDAPPPPCGTDATP